MTSTTTFPGIRTFSSFGILGFPLEERLDAVAEAGYGGISVNSLELTELDAGQLASVRRAGETRGIAFPVLEPYIGWLPFDATSRYGKVTLDEVIRVATAVGVASVCAIAPLDHGLSQAEVVDAFGAMTDRLHAEGLTTTLEFVPHFGIRTLREAIAVVDAAGRADSGIVFDTWHHFRTGGTAADLEGVRPGLIRFVQFSDAPTEPQGPPAEESWNRRLIGEGDIDFASIVRALRDIGGFDDYGTEVLRPVPVGFSCRDEVLAQSRTLDALLAAA
ncbi:sugar phosphate isomerase/epimerase [soil metagenome]